MPRNERQSTLLSRAKSMRSEQSPEEERLWYYLRAQRFMGLKFRRQKPMGQYIVDFVCADPPIIVEADGGQHATAKAYDEERDHWLSKQGFRVLRFWNLDVMRDIEGVLEAIRLAAIAAGWTQKLMADGVVDESSEES